MAPRSEEQIQEIREERKKQILNISLELFATNGYHSTSISMISKKAGISKGLLYNYFKGKEDLLYAIVKQASQVGEEMAEKALSHKDPKEGLKLLIEKVFSLLKQDQKYWMFFMSLMMQPGIMDNVKNKLQDQYSRSIREGEEFFQRLGYEDPTTEAFYFGALLDGVMIHSMANIDDYPFEKIKMKLINTYCK